MQVGASPVNAVVPVSNVCVFTILLSLGVRLAGLLARDCSENGKESPIAIIQDSFVPLRQGV